MEKKVPLRTCIACKKCADKRSLARIVKNSEGIFYDATGKLNGRGAYVCKDINCISKLKKQRLLNRAFSCQVEDEVYDKIAEDFKLYEK